MEQEVLLIFLLSWFVVGSRRTGYASQNEAEAPSYNYGPTQNLLSFTALVGHVLHLKLQDLLPMCNTSRFMVVEASSLPFPQWLLVSEHNGDVYGFPTHQHVGVYHLLFVAIDVTIGNLERVCSSLPFRISVVHTKSSLRTSLSNFLENGTLSTLKNTQPLYACLDAQTLYLATVTVNCVECESNVQLLSSVIKDVTGDHETPPSLIQFSFGVSDDLLYKQVQELAILSSSGKPFETSKLLCVSWPLGCRSDVLTRHTSRHLQRRSTEHGEPRMEILSWHITSGQPLIHKRQRRGVYFGSVTAIDGTPVLTSALPTFISTQNSFSTVLNSTSITLTESSTNNTTKSNFSPDSYFIQNTTGIDSSTFMVLTATFPVISQSSLETPLLTASSLSSSVASLNPGGISTIRSQTIERSSVASSNPGAFSSTTSQTLELSTSIPSYKTSLLQFTIAASDSTAFAVSTTPESSSIVPTNVTDAPVSFSTNESLSSSEVENRSASLTTGLVRSTRSLLSMNQSLILAASTPAIETVTMSYGVTLTSRLAANVSTPFSTLFTSSSVISKENRSSVLLSLNFSALVESSSLLSWDTSITFLSSSSHVPVTRTVNATSSTGNFNKSTFALRTPIVDPSTNRFGVTLYTRSFFSVRNTSTPFLTPVSEPRETTSLGLTSTYTSVTVLSEVLNGSVTSILPTMLSMTLFSSFSPKSSSSLLSWDTSITFLSSSSHVPVTRTVNATSSTGNFNKSTFALRTPIVDPSTNRFGVTLYTRSFFSVRNTSTPFLTPVSEPRETTSLGLTSSYTSVTVPSEVLNGSVTSILPTMLSMTQYSSSILNYSSTPLSAEVPYPTTALNTFNSNTTAELSSRRLTPRTSGNISSFGVVSLSRFSIQTTKISNTALDATPLSTAETLLSELTSSSDAFSAIPISFTVATYESNLFARDSASLPPRNATTATLGFVIPSLSRLLPSESFPMSSMPTKRSPPPSQESTLPYSSTTLIMGSSFTSAPPLSHNTLSSSQSSLPGSLSVKLTAVSFTTQTQGNPSTPTPSLDYTQQKTVTLLFTDLSTTSSHSSAALTEQHISSVTQNNTNTIHYSTVPRQTLSVFSTIVVEFVNTSAVRDTTSFLHITTYLIQNTTSLVQNFTVVVPSPSSVIKYSTSGVPSLSAEQNSSLLAPSPFSVEQNSTLMVPIPSSVKENDTSIVPSLSTEEPTLVVPISTSVRENSSFVVPTSSINQSVTVVLPSPTSMEQNSTFTIPGLTSVEQNLTLVVPTSSMNQSVTVVVPSPTSIEQNSTFTVPGLTSVEQNLTLVVPTSSMNQSVTVVLPSPTSMEQDSTFTVPGLTSVEQNLTLVVPTSSINQSVTVVLPSPTSMEQDSTFTVPGLTSVEQNLTLVVPTSSMNQSVTVVVPSPTSMEQNSTLVVPISTSVRENSSFVVPTSSINQSVTVVLPSPTSMEQNSTFTVPGLTSVEQNLTLVVPTSSMNQSVTVVLPSPTSMEQDSTFTVPGLTSVEQNLTLVVPTSSMNQSVTVVLPSPTSMEQDSTFTVPGLTSVEQNSTLVVPSPTSVEQNISLVTPFLTTVEENVTLKVISPTISMEQNLTLVVSSQSSVTKNPTLMVASSTSLEQNITLVVSVVQSSTFLIPSLTPLEQNSTLVVPSLSSVERNLTALPNSISVEHNVSLVVPSSASVETNVTLVVPSSTSVELPSLTSVEQNVTLVVPSSTSVELPSSTSVELLNLTSVEQNVTLVVPSSTSVELPNLTSVEQNVTLVVPSPTSVEQNSKLVVTSPTSVKENFTLVVSIPSSVDQNVTLVVPSSSPGKEYFTLVPTPSSVEQNSTLMVPRPTSVEQNFTVSVRSPSSVEQNSTVVNQVTTSTNATSALGATTYHPQRSTSVMESTISAMRSSASTQANTTSVLQNATHQTNGVGNTQSAPSFFSAASVASFLSAPGSSIVSSQKEDLSPTKLTYPSTVGHTLSTSQHAFTSTVTALTTNLSFTSTDFYMTPSTFNTIPSLTLLASFSIMSGATSFGLSLSPSFTATFPDEASSTGIFGFSSSLSDVLWTSSRDSVSTPVDVISPLFSSMEYTSFGTMATKARSPASALTIETIVVFPSSVVSLPTGTPALTGFSPTSLFTVSNVDSIAKSETSLLLPTYNASAVIVPTPSPDSSPILVNGIGYITASVGRLFLLQIPEYTFYDREDGLTSNLTLNCFLVTGLPLPESGWLRFNNVSRTLEGLPLTDDYKNQPFSGYQYVLTATDKSGNRALDAFVVRVSLSQPTLVFTITMKSLRSYSDFVADGRLRVLIVKKIAAHYGALGTSDIYIQSISNGSTIVNWSNTSLPTTFCPEQQLTSIRDEVLSADGIITSTFVQTLLPEFPAVEASFHRLGSCSNQPSPSPLIVPSRREGNESIFTSVSLPIILVIVVIVIIIAALLLAMRKRREAKKDITDREILRPSPPFRFQEEIEMKDRNADLDWRSSKPQYKMPPFIEESFIGHTQQGDEEEETSDYGSDLDPVFYVPPPPYQPPGQGRLFNDRSPPPAYRFPPAYSLPGTMDTKL